MRRWGNTRDLLEVNRGEFGAALKIISMLKVAYNKIKMLHRHISFVNKGIVERPCKEVMFNRNAVSFVRSANL